MRRLRDTMSVRPEDSRAVEGTSRLPRWCDSRAARWHIKVQAPKASRVTDGRREEMGRNIKSKDLTPDQKISPQPRSQAAKDIPHCGTPSDVPRRTRLSSRCVIPC